MLKWLTLEDETKRFIITVINEKKLWRWAITAIAVPILTIGHIYILNMAILLQSTAPNAARK